MRRHRDLKTTAYTIHKGNERTLKQKDVLCKKTAKNKQVNHGAILYQYSRSLLDKPEKVYVTSCSGLY